MPVARNMKELEKMIVEEIKKQLPKVTREYCHKWYNSNPEMKEIVSEADFIKMVNDSLTLSTINGKVEAKFGVLKDRDIDKEHIETMNALWKNFEVGYIKHIKAKLFK